MIPCPTPGILATGSPQQVGNPISYIWSDEGNYTVSLTVSDDGAAASTSSAIITVNNLSPSIVQASIPSGPHNEGSAALFSVQASDPGADTLSYLWDFGDGSPVASGEQIQHSFPDEGTLQRQPDRQRWGWRQQPVDHERRRAQCRTSYL